MKFLKQRIISFGYAFNGLWKALLIETNLKLHLLATVLVISAGLYFNINRFEMALLLLCIGAVLAAELLNTALEQLCNKLLPEKSPEVKFIKDVAAGAVLVAAITSVIVGGLIFWPYVFGG